MPDVTLVARNTPRLTLAGARAVLDAAERRAVEMKLPMDIAVVDDGGHLLAFIRMDGSKLGSVEVSITKAHSAAVRRMPSGPARTGDQVNLLLSLGITLASQNGQTPVRGGLPLVVDGICVGAIGVSSGTEDQDTDVAEAGVKAIQNA
jgi:glc operon protein GlcG